MRGYEERYPRCVESLNLLTEGGDNRKTVPEYWQDAGVTWQVYQNKDNFKGTEAQFKGLMIHACPYDWIELTREYEDNMLAYFKQYQEVSNDTDHPLTKFGNSYIGLDEFYHDTMTGNLPMVSYVIGPAELSEHPPWYVRMSLNAAEPPTLTTYSYEKAAIRWSMVNQSSRRRSN